MRNTTIAIVRLWPDHVTAEHECIERMRIAAESVGIKLVEIDRNGYYIKEPSKELQNGDVDFVIHLHFESPKCYDSFSYVTLWNPIRFYHDWGYERFSKHLISHDDFLSSNSKWAEDQILRLNENDEYRSQSFIELFPSVASPIHKPNLNNPRIFYCGINWERLGGSKGRHHDFLKALDEKKILKIFGPEIFHGVRVWKGFETYSGEIPFDGKTLIDEISKCGISLVFSSYSHIQSGIMSNRLFESLAGGAIVICDDNDFARRHFGDTLLYVDCNVSQEKITEQIFTHYQWICKNKEAAIEKAIQAQEIFLEKFELKKQFINLVEQHQQRIKEKQNISLAKTNENTVNVIIPIYDEINFNSTRISSNILKQSYSNIRAHFFVDEKVAANKLSDLQQSLKTKNIVSDLTILDMFQRKKKRALGEIVAKKLMDFKADYFMFMDVNEIWFKDHISTMIRKVEDNNNLLAVASDYVMKHFDPEGKEYRDFFKARIDLKSLQYNFMGTHLFSGRIIDEKIFKFIKYLHGRRMLFCLRNYCGNKVEFTEQMTCILNITQQEKEAVPIFVEEDIQTQILFECYNALPEAEFGNFKEVTQNYWSVPQFLASISNLSKREKNELSVTIFKNLPMPKFIFKILKAVYNLLIKRIFLK